MNKHTELSKEWRASMKAAGFVPKLIWIHPKDWKPVQKLLQELVKQHKENT